MATSQGGPSSRRSVSVTLTRKKSAAENGGGGGHRKSMSAVPRPMGLTGERTVKRLRLSRALTVPETTSITEACRRMAARRVDALLLTDSNALLCGILTDKDIATRVIAREVNPAETPVSKGDTILDRPVSITQWGNYEDDYNLRNHSSRRIENENRPNVVLSAGRAVSVAQDAVKTIAAKGYVLGKDAVGKAKAYGESHQVPAKVAELSEGIGLTDKIVAGVEAARSVDQRYHISGTTKSAVCATHRTAIQQQMLWYT